MRKKVKDILERELQRLDALSQESGLDLDEFRKLDLIIKAFKTFTQKNDPPSTLSNSVVSSSSEDLIKKLHEQNKD